LRRVYYVAKTMRIKHARPDADALYPLQKRA